MLSVTCDAFIHTLDECVKLATGDSSQSLILLSSLPSTTTDSTSTVRTSSSEMDSNKFVKFFYLFQFYIIYF